MKVSQKDKRVVLSADLIFPFAGEGTGAAVREHNGIKLKERLLTSTMFKLHTERGGKYEDFGWYLEDMVMANKTNPHAGYGIGNDRVMQFLLGNKDIRYSSLFSRLAEFTGDWDVKKRGQLFTLVQSANQKALLLSIGREANKKKLLPVIKNLKNSAYLLFATEHTHNFLQQNGVGSTLVYKISQKEKKPNLVTLLNENLFDIIINIPTRENGKSNESTDGQKIRQLAVDNGTTLITDLEVAEILLQKLAHKK